MATVDGLSKAYMQGIADASVTTGSVVGDNLHLTTSGGTVIDAGNVRGPVGNTGPIGPDGLAGGTTANRDVRYGVPTVLADQVALANKAPVWYNVDNGRLEIYLAPTGSAGLNVPGTSGAAGWYPTWWLDRLPLGLKAMQEYTTSTGSTSTLAVQQWIPTFTFKANRRYRVEWSLSVACSTAGSGLVQIHTCSTADAAGATTGLTEIMGYNLRFAVNSETKRVYLKREIQYTADTTLQLKGTINVGTGAWMQAGTTFPGQLSVTDMGQQF